MKINLISLIIVFFLFCNKSYCQKIMNLDQLIGLNNNNLIGDSIKLESETYYAFKKMQIAKHTNTYVFFCFPKKYDSLF